MMTWERFLKYISQVTVNENGIFLYLCVKIQVTGSLSFFFGMFFFFTSFDGKTALK